MSDNQEVINTSIEAGLSDSENTQKLKLLVHSLKKKYGETVTQAYNLDQKNREYAAENGTLKQTINALTLKFNQTLVELHDLEDKYKTALKEKSSSESAAADFEKEVKMLTEQHQTILSELSHHEEEAKKAIEELQAVKLKETQLERVIQFLRKRSEEAHLETNQLAQELSQLQELNQQLSEELKKVTAQNVELIGQLNQEKENLAKTIEETSQKCQEADSTKLILIEIQEENQHLKNTVEELKEELKKKTDEHFHLNREYLFLKQAMLREVEENKASLLVKQKEMEENFISSENEYKAQIESLERTIFAQKEEIHQYELKELEVQAAFETRNLVLAEQDKMKAALNRLQGEKEELEGDKRELEQKLKTAQHHLAKKVRESALILERNESDKERIRELSEELHQAHTKITELKSTLGMEVEHQRRALEREMELRKSADTQIQRLEERYFQIHEKWREAVSEAKELRKMEEKFHELKAFFGGFSNFAPATKVEPAEEASPPNFMDISPKMAEEKKPEEMPLFDNTPPRFKGSLF